MLLDASCPIVDNLWMLIVQMIFFKCSLFFARQIEEWIGMQKAVLLKSVIG